MSPAKAGKAETSKVLVGSATGQGRPTTTDMVGRDLLSGLLRRTGFAPTGYYERSLANGAGCLLATAATAEWARQAS